MMALALLAAGCTTWERTFQRSLTTTDTALVTTSDEAIVMRVESRDDQMLRGQLLERWTFTPDSRRSIERDASPTQLARANGWESTSVDQHHVEIPRSDITGVEVQRSGSGLGAAVGLLLGATLIFVPLFVEGMQGG